MSDKTTKPKVTDMPSGEIRVEIPATTKGDTRVDIDPSTGSREHEVHTDTTAEPTPAIEERRKYPAPLQVSVGQNIPSAGIMGTWAQIANTGAVVFVMVMFLIVWRDGASRERERDALVMEQIKLNRDSDERSGQRMERALTSLENKIDGQIRASDDSTRAARDLITEVRGLVSEVKAHRISTDAKLDKIITGLRPPGGW